MELNSNRNCFKDHSWHLKGFGKGLLAKQIASLVYELIGKTAEEPVSLKWYMRLNDNSSTHVAVMEIVISKTIALDHPHTQPNTVTCRTSTRKKRRPVTKQNDCLW